VRVFGVQGGQDDGGHVLESWSWGGISSCRVIVEQSGGAGYLMTGIWPHRNWMTNAPMGQHILTQVACGPLCHPRYKTVRQPS
jgi:hypothetical protein